MQQPYNWKRHYADPLEEMGESAGFFRYRLRNETGEGDVTACAVLPGVQAIYNDLRLLRCGCRVAPNDGVIEITYCTEGRYECSVSDRYCFFVGAGYFSVGTVGRRETRGCFPTGRFRGVTLFLERGVLSRELGNVLDALAIDLGKINEIAARRPRYFVIQRNKRLETILCALAGAYAERRLPMLKLKTMELLMFLSEANTGALGDQPVYVNGRQAALAEAVRGIILADLSAHVTIEQMAATLHSGTTALKAAFKSVYGVSIYQYLKDYRLQQAQRLLRETDATLCEIARFIGYENPGKFTAAFKERFSVAPAAYRDQARMELTMDVKNRPNG